MYEVFYASRQEIFHSVGFSAAHKDRVLNQGRRRGMQFPNYFPSILPSPDHTAQPQSTYEVARQREILLFLRRRQMFLGGRQNALICAHGPSKGTPNPKPKQDPRLARFAPAVHTPSSAMTPTGWLGQHALQHFGYCSHSTMIYRLDEL